MDGFGVELAIEESTALVTVSAAVPETVGPETFTKVALIVVAPEATDVASPLAGEPGDGTLLIVATTPPDDSSQSTEVVTSCGVLPSEKIAIALN
jgi:hypothetical protein